MNADVIIRWIRAVLLLALLGYFASSLVVGLLKDRSAGGFGLLRQGLGQDVGVRVLLCNRLAATAVAGKEAPEPTRTHEHVELTIFQPVDVVTPDDPDGAEHRLALPAGAKLMILPDANDGLVLSSREWGAGGKEVRWQVSRVVIQPKATNPAPSEAEAVPARRDACSFEAADGDAVFGLHGRRYRGSAEVMWATAKEVLLLNCLPIEAYTEGVVAVEMSASYPLEALKAQAIASRSYAYSREWAARAARQPFDLLDGDDDQDYRGTGNGPPLIARAVFETRGTVTFTDLPQGAYPFAPLFCASSGGYTAPVETVFPAARDAYGQPLPPGMMPGQPDPFCQPGADGLGNAATHWQTVEVITPAQIRAALARLYKQTNDPRLSQVGYIRDLRVGRRDPRSNRVETVMISHTIPNSPPIELPAHLFRMAIGPSRVRSTLWSTDSPKKIDSQDASATKHYQITSIGYGHGVGMSQISAWEMARQGHPARAILSFFYPRVVLRTIW
jgi:SpoIID/LytB domain protein